MTRLRKRILRCIALGIVSTVGVAWGAALFGSSVFDKYYGAAVTKRTAPTAFTEFHHITIMTTFGMTAVRSVRQREFHSNALVDYAPLRIPYWAGSVAEPTTDFLTGRTMFEERDMVATGWPFRVFRCEAIEPFAEPPVLDYGVFIDSAGRTRMVPYRPILTGVLGDVLVHAALWYFLLHGYKIRREFRCWRGRCPKCNYDLRHELDRGCPECGWNRAERDDA